MSWGNTPSRFSRAINEELDFESSFELLKSFKNAGQIDRAFLAGAHTATMDPAILKDVLTQPYITNAVDTFDSDWKSVFAEKTISEL